VECSCENSKKPSGSIEIGEFIDQMSHLSDSQTDSASWNFYFRGHKDTDKDVPVPIGGLEIKIYAFYLF
jgi:hypothetical protein